MSWFNLSGLYCRHQILIAVILVMIVSFTGCSKVKVYKPVEYLDNDYTTYIQQEGDAHFSFLYPKYYDTSELEVSLGDVYDDSHDGKAIFFGIPFTKEHTMIFFITYYDKYNDLSDVNDAVNERLKWIKEQASLGFFENYKLIEKSKVEVSGISGKELIHSYIWATEIGPVEAFPCIEREIFLYHDGRIWEIKYLSDVSVKEQANTTFENILQTFRILD